MAVAALLFTAAMAAGLGAIVGGLAQLGCGYLAYHVTLTPGAWLGALASLFCWGLKQQPKRPPERGAGDAVKRLLLVGVAAGGTAEAWVVQRQRSPNHGHPPRQLTLDRDGQLPPLRGARLEQGVGARGAEGLAARRGQQRGRAAVDDGLRGSDDDDHVGLEQVWVDAERDPAQLPDLDQGGVLDVVDHDPAAKTTSELRRDDSELLEAAVHEPSCETSCNEKGLVLHGDSGSPELVDDGADRRSPRIVLRGRDRQRRRLDHDRRPASAGDERLERLAG